MVIIDPPDKITVCIGQPVRFEAVAYTSDGVGFISSPEWTWEFDDGDTSAKNPTEHAYAKEGSYTVIVTATAKEGTGTAETTVEVVGDGGGGDALLVSNLYMRDPITKATVGVPCDVVQVVFETTDSMVMELKLLRQSPPDVPNTWHEMGGATYENTGIPGLQRWYWTWLTLGDKNWPVNFKVTYKKPGTPPPFPPPMVPVTFGPVTWTPGNAVVHSDDVILPWNGDDPQTIPWTITHANRDNPKFTVTVCIYMIDSTSPIKTFTLTNQGLGAGSVPWNGEVNQGMPPAPPGIYTYQVTAVHDAFPMCQNGDKSAQLTPEVAHFWCVYLNEQAETMEVNADYTLNREAGACRIEVWGPDTATGEYPVHLGDLSVPDQTAGTHLSGTTTIAVLVDENGDVDGRIHAVIYGTETTQDGQLNRDLLPKFAMQRNAAPPESRIDLDATDLFHGGAVPDRCEVQFGAHIHRNVDNDNLNQGPIGGPVEDEIEDDVVTDENDLMCASISFAAGTPTTGTVFLQRSSGAVQVWTSPTKGMDHALMIGGLDLYTSWDLSDPDERADFEAIRQALWIEGTDLTGENSLTARYEAEDSTELSRDVVTYHNIAATCGWLAPVARYDSLQSAFPGLVGCEWSVLDDPTPVYNCIAWSVGDTWVWWNPVGPCENCGHRCSIEVHCGLGLVDGKLTDQELNAWYQGYGLSRTCPLSPPDGVDVACYADFLIQGNEVLILLGHAAARQGCACGDTQQCGCGNEKWSMFSSKLGGFERIEHRYEQLNGQEYGEPTIFYAR